MRLGLLLVALSLVAFGCRGGEELPEGMRPLSELPPEEPEEEPEPEAEPELEPELEPEPEPDPDPQPEPNDGAFTVLGVHVPGSAFRINEEIDLDRERQRFHLEFVLEAYYYANSVLGELEFEEQALRSYFAGSELDGILASLEQLEASGERQVQDGTEVVSVGLSRFDAAGAAVDLCLWIGEGTGNVDVETGEFVRQPEPHHRPVTYLLAFTDVEDGEFEWRIVGGGVNREMSCP